MSEGPFKAAFNVDLSGVVRREIITYRVKDDMMVKESAYRDYYENGNYHDTMSTIPIVKITN